MDHLTPGYRENRLRRSERPHTARTVVWAAIGALVALAAILCAHVAPDALVIAGLLAGLMYGATR